MGNATDACQPGGARFGALGSVPAVPPLPTRPPGGRPRTSRLRCRARRQASDLLGVPRLIVPGTRSSAFLRSLLPTEARHLPRAAVSASAATRFADRSSRPPGGGCRGAMGSEDGRVWHAFNRRDWWRAARRETNERPDGRSQSKRKAPWRWPTLPGRRRPSTIGASGLNDRVRNGTGCTPAALITKGRFHNVRYSVVQPNSASLATSG